MSAAPATASAAPAPSEPQSDTPVELSTHAPTDARVSDEERSEPSSTSAANAGSRARGDEERTKRPFSNTRADSPQAKGERARQNAPLRVSVPPRDAGTSLSRWLMVSLVIAALIMGGRWYLQSRAQKAAADTERTQTAATTATDTPRATALEPSAVAVPQVAETTTASAGPTAAAPSAAPETTALEAAPSAPTPSAADPSAASAAPSVASPPTPGMRVVVVKISPPGARLFRKGKPIGSSPVTIELAPGEKRSFEVGMPGWVTRRLVVDGTKPEIFIGLKPEK